MVHELLTRLPILHEPLVQAAAGEAGHRTQQYRAGLAPGSGRGRGVYRSGQIPPTSVPTAAQQPPQGGGAAGGARRWVTIMVARAPH